MKFKFYIEWRILCITHSLWPFQDLYLNIADSATVLMQNIMNVAVLVEVTHGKGIQQDEI